MSTHTPGPWRLAHEGGVDGGYYIEAKDQVVVLPKGRIDEPDARLIAAAPDLLAVCKRMIAHAGIDMSLGSAEVMEFVRIHAEMRAAIAKAEGVL